MQPIIKVEDGDELRAKLLTVGSSLRPVDDENYFFFEIVRELVDSTLTNYDQLRQGYVAHNYPLLAWACRNLIELTIFLKYVLISEANARRFGDDRLIDGCEIINALRDLERHYDPTAATVPLDDALVRMQKQMAAENVTATKHLEVRSLAEIVGHKEEFAAMNRVSSKLVHPTGWSVLAMNPEGNSFPDSRDILFQFGIGYVAQVLIATKEHNDRQAMRPNP